MKDGKPTHRKGGWSKPRGARGGSKNRTGKISGWIEQEVGGPTRKLVGKVTIAASKFGLYVNGMHVPPPASS